MAAIALSRRFPAIEDNVYNATGWGCPVGKSLIGRKALIVGFGGIGRALALRLKPFGVHISVIKRDTDERFKAEYKLDVIETLDNFDKHLAVSDYIFIALPLTDSTKTLINVNNIFRIQKGAFLINPSRGAIIEKDALIKALEQEHLGGVALDVFWQEPPPKNDKLFSYKNVLVSPHIAGVTDVSYKAIAFYVCENISRIAKGERPINCVNC